MVTQITAPEVSKNGNTGASRRDFLVTSAGGLTLGFFLPGVTRLGEAAPPTINSYIKIGTDESITVLFGGCEMGQGAMSGLIQIVAEELRVDWNKVKYEVALASSISYLTGGSSAIRVRYGPMRNAGAAVRLMLTQAAANQWGVPVSSCTAVNGTITCPGNTPLTYGQLAAAAAALPVPTVTSADLTPESQFQLIGKSVQRLDIPEKVCGKAIFGIDVMLPGMVFAVIKQCPTINGTVASVGSKPSGAIAVVNLGNGVAVVADNTYKAKQLASQVSVKWNIPADSASNDSAAFLTTANQILASGPVLSTDSAGDPNGAMLGATKTVDVTYTFPHLAHAYMEVLNCTANVTPASCDIWCPTQAATSVRAAAQQVTGLPASAITVHTTFLGGGLGRKIETDYAIQAIKTSQALGKPVKLTWMREEDFTHDYYRPAAVARVQAGVDAAGNIVAWKNRTVSQSILLQHKFIGPGVLDSQAVEGAVHLPYALPNRITEWGPHPCTIPVGFWRSVGCSFNSFYVESIIDELALLAGQDPYQFRRNLMIAEGSTRQLAVLDAVASMCDWAAGPPSGRARGIAFVTSFGTHVAEVVEISGSATSVRVNRVWCAVDPGRAINPNSVEAQMQGGIIHGLSAALWGRIPFTAGQATVKNFNRYRTMRLSEAPQISVQIIPSTLAPSGIGEPGVPPSGPALANAFFKLTGQRVRNLPFFPNSTMGDI